MALFSKNNFLVPYSDGDQMVFIQDTNDFVIYKVKPWNVTASYVQDVNIILKTLGTDNLIRIPFSTHNEAVEALTIFQDHLNDVKAKILNVPDEIKDYIDSRIFELIQNSFFSFRQDTPSDTWEVSGHPLDKKPSVMVTNDQLEEIEGLVQYIDDETVLVKFNVPLTGWVFLN